MKISYTTLSVQNLDARQAVEIAVQYGLDGIELRGRDKIHISPSCSFSYVSEVKKIIEASGLGIPCITAYTKFRQRTVEKVRADVDQLMEMVSLAEYMGAGCVRIFLGEVPAGMEKDRSDAVAAEGLRYAAEKLGTSPVRLAIETHDSGKSGKSLEPLLKEVPSSIGVLLDIIHPWDERESIEETWRAIGTRIYHVHIKDIRCTVEDGRIYSRIGEGLLPVGETVDWLKKHGYEGFYSLEWEKSAEWPPFAREAAGVSFEEQMDSFITFMRGRN
ncbi:sugar phosphate isomerase/epimerase family protein [Lacrimispora sp.]|uniref:sugar phosphate isomerase/epimerase family protein n=1 Tax=Lacrimispora sp. TaxID=2719234 RepID=UPI0028A7C586|nr:sugar phosphate isomerase/epimerase family protein [Lacrimispora sp.]